MKSKWIFPLILSLSSLCLIGCVGTLDDRHQAGMPWVKDTVEGRYEFPPAQIWTAAKDVLRHQGTLVSEDTLKNVLEASVDNRTVYVKVEELDTRATRVLIQARGGGGSDLEMAGFIKEQIAVRLATGNLTPAAHR